MKSIREMYDNGEISSEMGMMSEADRQFFWDEMEDLKKKYPESSHVELLELSCIGSIIHKRRKKDINQVMAMIGVMAIVLYIASFLDDLIGF